MARIDKRSTKETASDAYRNVSDDTIVQSDGRLASLESGGSEQMGEARRVLEEEFKDDGQLHQQIAERAFCLYEESGFQDGHDLEHWLEAERQVRMIDTLNSANVSR